MNDAEAANRAAAEHVERTRRRLSAGQEEIARQQASLADLRDHSNGASRWATRSETQLGEERSRRAGDIEPPVD